MAALAHVSNVRRIGGIGTGSDCHAAFIVPHRFVRIVARHAIYLVRQHAGVRRPAEFIPFHVVIRELHDGGGPAGWYRGHVNGDAEHILGATRTDQGATRTGKIAAGMAVAHNVCRATGSGSCIPVGESGPPAPWQYSHCTPFIGGAVIVVRPTTLDPCCVPCDAIHRGIRSWCRTGYGAISAVANEAGCIMAAVAVGRHGHLRTGKLVEDPVLREQVTLPASLARPRIEVAHDVFHLSPGHSRAAAARNLLRPK